jgi:hypothetical protein
LNWDALGAIAETIGGLATVATLAYLAVQIRQSTKAAHAASAGQYREGNAGFSSIVAADEQLAELYFRGLEDPDSLSPLERNRFGNLIGMVLSYLHQAEEMQTSGVLSEGIARTRDGQVIYFASKPGFRRVYARYHSAQPLDFARRMDLAIEAIDLEGPSSTMQDIQPSVK